MKKKYHKYVIGLILMFAFCVAGWSREFDIRDRYRFITDMPLDFLNYFTCYFVIAFSSIFIIIEFYRTNTIRKSKIAFFLSLTLVSATTIRNYIYYSKEVELLSKEYVEIISLEKFEKLVENHSPIKVYIESDKWEISDKCYSLIREYAYLNEEKVYVIKYMENQNDLLQRSSILRKLHISSFPALIIQNDKGGMEILNSDEICNWISK